MKVNWKGNGVWGDLYFEDLNINDTFRIVSNRSHGAVYVKVLVGPKSHDPKHMMYEIATGNVFPATPSRVERVDVDVHVNANKPQLQGY